MAQLNFPDNPLDGQLYPNPCPTGVTQYRWDTSTGIWRIVGVATGVIPGTYGDEVTVGQFVVNVNGEITFAQNIPIRGATVTAPGIVQLNDTTFGISTTEALTARAGKYLQDQIGNLSVCTVPDHVNVVAALNDLQAQTTQLQTDALIWCGYYNAEEGDISYVSLIGQRLGYQIGQELPLPGPKNGGDFFVVSKAGNPYVAGDFNAPNTYVEQGNWIISETARWSEMVVVGEVQAKDVTYVPAAPLTATNVQNAITQITQLFRTGIGGATVSSTRPDNPYPGQLWWDNDDGLFYVFYTDVNGSQWVEAGGGGSQGLEAGGGVYEIRTGIGLTGGPITTEGTIDLEPAFLDTKDFGNSIIGGVIPNKGFDYSNTTGVLNLLISGDFTGKDPNTAFSQEGANVLNNKINSLSGSNILAGTYDAAQGVMVYVTPAGEAKGFKVGENVPSPSAAIDNYYAIVTVPGEIGPGGPDEPSQAADWWICQADTVPAIWFLIDYQTPGASASNTSVTPIPGIEQATDVQRALELLELQAQDRLEFVESTTNGLQISVTQPGLTYDGTTLSIGLDYASVGQRGIVQLTNDVTGNSETLAVTQSAVNALNAKVDSLTGANVLAATYNSNTGTVVSVTPAGAAAGFAPGAQAPTAEKTPDNYYMIVTVSGGYGPPGAQIPAGGVQSGDWFICENTGGGVAYWMTIDYENRQVAANQVNITPVPGLSATQVQQALDQIQAEVVQTITGVASGNDGITVATTPVNADFGYNVALTLNPATTTDIGGVFVAPNNGLTLTPQGGLALSIASPTKLGGIKIGQNLSITADGTLNAQAGKQAEAKIQPIKDISPQFDGSTATFELELEDSSAFPTGMNAELMFISVGGVLQDPQDAYIFNAPTAQITFTSPPPTGATFSGRAIISYPVAGTVSGVDQIIAGDNVTISPPDGVGVVRIDVTGGGAAGVSSIKSGSPSLVVTPTAGTGDVTLTCSASVQSITATGPLSGGTITTTGSIGLSDSGVTAGSYTNANITVDQWGRVTAAANGQGGGGGDGTVTQIVCAEPLTGGTITTSGGIGPSASGVTPADYVLPKMSVDQWGLVTQAEDGDSSDLPYQLAAQGSVLENVYERLSKFVLVTDFGAVGDGVADDTVAISSALTYLENSGGGTLYFPRGTYKMTGGVTLNRGGIILQGDGWEEFQGEYGSHTPNLRGQGTWIYWEDPAVTPFTFALGGGNMVQVRDMAFYQSQPDPGPGWTPVAYQPTFQINAGACLFSRLYFFGVYRGVSVGSAGKATGRSKFEWIWGEFFDYGIQINFAADVVEICDYHQYTFWSHFQDDVATYCRANTKGIVSLRNDNPQLSNIFMFGIADGVLVDGTGPDGPTAKMAITNFDADFCTTGLHVKGSLNSVSVANFNSQCGPPSPSTSRNVWIEGGNDNFVKLVNCRWARSNRECMRVDGTYNWVGIVNLDCNNWDDSQTGNFNAIYAGDATNKITLSGFVYFADRNTTASELGGAQSVYNWANFLKGTGSWTTNGSGQLTIPCGSGFNRQIPQEVSVVNKAQVPYVFTVVSAGPQDTVVKVWDMSGNSVNNTSIPLSWSWSM